jgi:hypothetical protein
MILPASREFNVAYAKNGPIMGWLTEEVSGAVKV